MLVGADDAIATRPLGREERLIGARDKIFRNKPRVDSATNGGGSGADSEHTTLDARKRGILNRSAGPFADCSCLLLIGIGKNGTKLFASVASNYVDAYADTVLKQLGYLFETEVAMLVTGCVVYFLEAVNVDHEYPDPAPVTNRDFAQSEKSCIEIAPVEEPRERIQVGEAAQLRVHNEDVINAHPVKFVE